MVHKKQSNKKYSHLQNNQKLNLSDKKLNGPSEDNSQAGSVPEGHLTSCGKDEEKQKETTQFKMSFKLPVGEGAPSAEEESPGDQFKRQLIDNLFNLGM